MYHTDGIHNRLFPMNKVTRTCERKEIERRKKTSRGIRRNQKLKKACWKESNYMLWNGSVKHKTELPLTETYPTYLRMHAILCLYVFSHRPKLYRLRVEFLCFSHFQDAQWIIHVDIFAWNIYLLPIIIISHCPFQWESMFKW